MNADTDEDALSWAGDEPDRISESSTARPPAPIASPDPVAAAPATPAPLLITYGVLAGIYLIYTIGWAIQVANSTVVLADPFGDLMWQLGEALAVAAPALWLASAFLMTRGRRPILRLIWLLVGLLVLLPWPTFTGGL